MKAAHKGLVCVLAIALTAPVLGATTLTGVSVAAALSNGNGILPYWNTLGGDLLFNLYLQDGATWLNSGNGAAASVDIPLAPGNYSYALSGELGVDLTGYYIIDLFFDGDNTTPGISALWSNRSHTLVADGGLTVDLDATSLQAGANTLVFQDSQTRVTLTSFIFGASTANLVQGYDNSPTPGTVVFGFPIPGLRDSAGTLTLQVQAIPEPGSVVLLGGGLVLLLLLGRRRYSRTA